jgi:type I restriction enzyme R subunit
VNRTNTGKSRGFIVDYYGLSDYLTEALEMFSSEDVAGALKDLKDELPKLKAAHTRVMRHFKGIDKNDIDAGVLALEDPDTRQQFEIDFKIFCRQMDIVMPDAAANPYIGDLKFLGKVNHGAKNRYRDAQLDIAGVGEKVRALIDEHIRATGVDPKIPPVDLLATDFKKHLNAHKSDRAKASEMEHAIKHHIDVHMDEDPEYYKSLSDKLNAIIAEQHEHWKELVQRLLDFGNNIKKDHAEQAHDLGLSDNQYAFYNILMAEIARATNNEAIDQTTHDKVIEITKDLVELLDEATHIVDFFKKQDEVNHMKRTIKRRLIKDDFDDPKLRTAVMDRFMELARVKYAA